MFSDKLLSDLLDMLSILLSFIHFSISVVISVASWSTRADSSAVRVVAMLIWLRDRCFRREFESAEVIRDWVIPSGEVRTVMKSVEAFWRRVFSVSREAFIMLWSGCDM